MIEPRAFPDSDATGLVDLEAIPPPAAAVGSSGGNTVGASDTGFQESFTVVQDGGRPVRRPPPPPPAGPATSGYGATRLLSLERSYSETGGWAIQMFLLAPLASATDVSPCTAGFASGCAEASGAPLGKTLLLDLFKAAPGLGVECDNYEAIALGPLLPDGRQLLLLVNDDNCANIDPSTCWGGDLIGTQFLAFAFDLTAGRNARFSSQCNSRNDTERSRVLTALAGDIDPLLGSPSTGAAAGTPPDDGARSEPSATRFGTVSASFQLRC